MRSAAWRLSPTTWGNVNSYERSTDGGASYSTVQAEKPYNTPHLHPHIASTAAQ